MALSTTYDKQATIAMTAAYAKAVDSAVFTKVEEPIILPEAANSVVEQHKYDSALAWTEQTSIGAITATTFYDGAITITCAPYQQMTQVAKEQALLNPNLIMEKAAELGLGAVRSMESDWLNAIATARTTAHPFADQSWLAEHDGGGSPKWVDNLQISMNDAGSTTFTQTNDHSLNFSASAVNTLISNRRKSLGGGGLPADPYDKCVLVVETDNENHARALAKQEGRVYTGAGMDLGFAGLVDDVIADNYGKLNSGAFAALFSQFKFDSQHGQRLCGPIAVAIMSFPSVTVMEASDGNHYNIKGFMEWGLKIRPHQWNIQYSEA